MLFKNRFRDAPLAGSQLFKSVQPWAIFVVGVLFYCFAYFLRVYVGVLEKHIVQFLNIDATVFGLITSFYYFSYAPLQVPVGLAIDKVGPRRALIFACSVAVIGAYIFATMNGLLVALMGRFLVGAGSAFAYVTALKLATMWLPRRYFSLATGCLTAFGMVAAIFTDNVLTMQMASLSLFEALMIPAVVGLVVLFLIVSVVQDRKKPEPILKSQVDDELEGSAVSFAQLRDYVLKIVKHPQMWLIGFIGAFLYLPSSVFLDTWALPYLRVARHLSASHAAYCVSLMFSGWICASILSGYLTEALGNRKWLLVGASTLSLSMALIIFYVPHLNMSLLMILMFVFGVGCGPHPLCFTLAKENFPIAIAGTAISFANFVIMMGGFIFQPIVGHFLDRLRHGRTLHGHPFYTPHDFKLALVIIPIALLLSLLLSLFVKDTYGQHDTVS